MDETIISNVDVKPSRRPPLHIPTEVCENVIDMLFSLYTKETLANIATLRSCALVCRAWRVRSQKRLFYLVQLSDTTSLRRLSTILANGPHLRDYVYCVELTGYHLHTTTSIFGLFPAVLAGKLPNLERVDVAHIPDTVETRFPKTAISPKAKSTPYIPLHGQLSAILRSFTTVSELYLEGTTFRSFSEIIQIIRALTNLQELMCRSVRWITTGSSRLSADVMRQPDWAAERHTLPPFAPKIRTLWLHDIALYGADTLILAHGTHLTYLDLTVPLLEFSEQPIGGRGIDLGSCTTLETLVLSLTSFSMDTHAGFVKDLLSSWKPQHLKPYLVLRPRRARMFTRRAFGDILRSLGGIIEEWLQTLQESHLSSRSKNNTHVKYQMRVQIYDWEAEEEWWKDHLKSCFPTWEQLKRLSWRFETPRTKFYEWAQEEEFESPKSDTSIPASRVEEVDSGTSASIKNTVFPHMTETT